MLPTEGKVRYIRISISLTARPYLVILLVVTSHYDLPHCQFPSVEYHYLWKLGLNKAKKL